jgi:tetratricopeptide (TPR) repeat protein
MSCDTRVIFSIFGSDSSKIERWASDAFDEPASFLRQQRERCAAQILLAVCGLNDCAHGSVTAACGGKSYLMSNDSSSGRDLESEMKRVRGLSEQGRDVEAIVICDELVTEYPGRFEPYFRRALSRHSMGDRSGALTDLSEAIALNPDEPASLFFRGRWQIEAGAYADGIEDLRRAILADEALGSAYYAESARISLAIAYFLAGRFGQCELACKSVSANARTYLAGRLWTIADLRR